MESDGDYLYKPYRENHDIHHRCCPLESQWAAEARRTGKTAERDAQPGR